jgi:hypothetical protein
LLCHTTEIVLKHGLFSLHTTDPFDHYCWRQYFIALQKILHCIDERIIANTCHTILQRFEWCLCHYHLIQYLSYNTKEIQMLFVSILFDIIVAIQYYRDSTDGCVITIWYDTCHTIVQRFEWCLCHYYLIQYLPYNTTQILLIEWIITVWYNTCHKMLQRFEWCLRHYRLIQYLPYKTRDSIDELIITVWYNTCHTILQRFEWCLCHYRLIQYLPHNTTEIRLMNGSLPFDIIVAMQYYRD